jgi:DNA-3-methyladenine glycosylase
MQKPWRQGSRGKCSQAHNLRPPERIRKLHTTSDLAHEVRRLSRAGLPSDTAELARYLIGKTIVRKIGRSRISGRIVETEAYPPGDRSGHAYIGRTPRNQSLFLGRGFAYVYFIYGTSYMLNVSSEESGIGAGVLLRAIEPLEGIEVMKRLRQTDKLTDLARGPGRLAAALDIDKRFDGIDLCVEGPLWLGTAVRDPGRITTAVRIGITRDVDRPLRFFEAGSPFVSGPLSQRRI